MSEGFIMRWTPEVTMKEQTERIKVLEAQLASLRQAVGAFIETCETEYCHDEDGESEIDYQGYGTMELDALIELLESQRPAQSGGEEQHGRS